MWGAAWLYCATGDSNYLSLAINQDLFKNFKALLDLRVLSWDNKLPTAMLLLTRLTMFMDQGYPYENMMRSYHNLTDLTMCSYFHQYSTMSSTGLKIDHILGVWHLVP